MTCVCPHVQLPVGLHILMDALATQVHYVTLEYALIASAFVEHQTNALALLTLIVTLATV
jgi:hypothetical protein